MVTNTTTTSKARNLNQLKSPFQTSLHKIFPFFQIAVAEIGIFIEDQKKKVWFNFLTVKSTGIFDLKNI